MADVHDKKTRSKNMSRIKGKNTKPEMIVRKYLHATGFRYSLHSKKIPGKPDIVLKKYNTIIDVRGCFWHLHSECKYGSEVNTASKTISEKRKSAIERDKRNIARWEELGWKVIVIWADCCLEPRKKTSEIRKETLNNLVKELKN